MTNTAASKGVSIDGQDVVVDAICSSSTLEVSRAKMPSVELLEIPFSVWNEGGQNRGDAAVDALGYGSALSVASQIS